MITEASRAKHKFAAKRNSWPKTRGVAMNPVDHVSSSDMHRDKHCILTHFLLYSLTVVVIINISVKPPQSLDMPHKVKRPVSLLPGELVCSVVPKRQRTRFNWAACLFVNDRVIMGKINTLLLLFSSLFLSRHMCI